MGSDLEIRNYHTIHLYCMIIKVMARPYQLQRVFDGDMASPINKLKKSALPWNVDRYHGMLSV